MQHNPTAKFLRKNESFILSLADENKEADRILLKEDKTIAYLKDFSDKLGYSDLDVMIKEAESGDRSYVDLKTDIESRDFFDLKEVKKLIDEYSFSLKSDLEQTVREELINNYRADFASAVIENVYEKAALQIFEFLQNLALDKLLIDSKSLYLHSRLIEILARHAGDVNIRIEII